MIDTVLRMVRDWEAHRDAVGALPFPLNEGDSCTAYGGCPQRTVCLSENPEPWLASGFVQRVWNPLTRDEESAS